MPKTRRMWTNFSKGELSGLLEGMPDLRAYFEGGAVMENYVVLRQGGFTRSPGTRFVKEVKDSSKDTILWPFEFSVDDAYMLEVGDQYIRMYKTKAPVLNGGVHVEVASPYLDAQLRAIHFTQLNDVMFLFHAAVQQRKLNRVSDTSWSMTLQTPVPPPSFEADTDVGGAATLTPAATTGSAVVFTASVASFLNADVGRQIIFGASRAVIVTFTSTTVVEADILDDFPNTDPIPGGSWLLRLSPQTTLDPTIAGPAGATVTFTAGVAAFRAADVGKYIVVYGGVIRLTVFTTSTSVRGQILSTMSEVSGNPAAAPAGAWTLEVASWSAQRGYPRTGEFLQGRLYQVSTDTQKTTWWGSKSDDFDNYARGVTAEDAVEHTIASRQLNRLEWITEKGKAIFIGTSGAELRADGSGSENAVIGGDVIPSIEHLATNGCMPTQPIRARKTVLYADRSRRKILAMGFDLENDGDIDKEVSVGAEHITQSGIRLGPMAFVKRLNPRLYFVREDGTLVTMTFFPEQKVVAFSRRVTQGTFEAVGVIPSASRGDDEVWVIVKRSINGQDKRYVEMFEPAHEGLTARAWTSLYTDCAVVLTGLTGTTVSGVPHLVGKTVDVVKNGSALAGTYIVASGGTFEIEEELVAEDVLEVGLHYDSDFQSMEPSIEGEVIEGLPRSWDSFFVRVKDSKGGTVNGQAIIHAPGLLDSQGLFTGKCKVNTTGWNTDGRIRIQQTQPYPQTVLCGFGTLSLGDKD